MSELNGSIWDAEEEGSPTHDLEVEDARVATLSLLVSGVNTFLQGTTTDTPEVDVDALSILGRSAGMLEVGVPSMGSCWAGSPLSKERFASASPG